MIENTGMPIDSEDVLVVRKLSGWEYSKKLYNLDDEQLKKWYLKNHQDLERMLSSHNIQMESVKTVTRTVGDIPILTIEDINHQVVNRAKLVVVLGGDNFFQQVSHFVHTPLMLGINTDPAKSEAEALPFTDKSFAKIWPKIQAGHYYFIKWTRLEAAVNGVQIPYLAASEAALASSHPFGMSRYIVEYRGVKEELKNTGINVATGLGSTGWTHSVNSCPHKEGPTFSKDQVVAFFHVREKFYSKILRQRLDEGYLEEGEVLRITWIHHFPGLLGVDPTPYEEFVYLNRVINMGDVVTVRISDHPLTIIKEEDRSEKAS